LDLKAVFHYSYFIHPIVISADRRKAFLERLLADKSWRFNTGRNEADTNTQAYFLPYVKRLLFPTVFWSSAFHASFERMDHKKQTDMVASLPSASFDLRLDHAAIGKGPFTRDHLGVEITRITLFCFESGITFLVIKTILDSKDVLYMGDVLDFNHKFRTLNPRYLKKQKTDGLFIRNTGFGKPGELSSFIKKLLSGFEDLETENVYFDRLFTYSYLCLDETEWNAEKPFERILNEFGKFRYVLPSDYGSEFDPAYTEKESSSYRRWKYSMTGFSRESCVVLASACEAFNRNKLPEYFETLYFHIFLLAFYQRISLILFSEEMTNAENIRVEEMKRRFTRFTHFSWFSQITNSEHGMELWKKWQDTFDLAAQFNEVQKEYQEYYDYKVAKGQERINILLVVIYVISVFFSALTLLVDAKALRLDTRVAQWMTGVICVGTAAAYPIYVLFRTFAGRVKRRIRRQTS